VDTIKCVERYESRITSLEFTAMSVSIYRFCYTVKNIVVLLKIYSARKSIAHVLSQVNKLCIPPAETSEASTSIRRRLRIVAVSLWLIGILAVGATLLACYLSFKAIASKKVSSLFLYDCSGKTYRCWNIFGEVDGFFFFFLKWR
jgi:hypothetical protein